MGLTTMEFLDDAPREVARRCLTEESVGREHLVIALSGSHAYGFPSHDSDLDLKAIHVAPTDHLLGLTNPRQTFNRLEVIDGVEIDYTSNEVGPVLAGILAGNGNYIERVLGPLLCGRSPELDALAELVRASLSVRVHGHYAGFARSQIKALETATQPTAKKLLYVLRTALTGVHLLTTGELETDLGANALTYRFPGVAELIEQKRAGERTRLAAGDLVGWRAEIDRAMALLATARERSPLPAEPKNQPEINSWLIQLRRAR